MHRICLSLTFIFISFSTWSQDLDFVKKQVKILTSPKYSGRGYVKNGDIKASEYLAKQLKSFGLLPFGKDYFQHYSFDVNTFPGKMDVVINGQNLVAGKDFYVNPGSKGASGSFPIIRFGLNEVSKDTAQIRAFFKANHSKQFIMLDTAGWGSDPFRKGVREAISGNLARAMGVIEVVDTGTIYSVKTFEDDYTRLTVRRRTIPADAASIQLSIDQKLVNHKARNLVGYLPGETDTFIVFTAHYDHLGMMGKSVYFPGANDNASGTAMVLDMMRELSKKKTHRYSYAFMIFSGEEAGLLGSHYYAENPLFPLKKIKQVLNFDMVGTGAGGLFVFNGSVLKNEFALLDTINKVNHFGVNLVMKSTSRGSDHYSFHAKGVPALFLLTDEKHAPYHVPEDRFDRLSFLIYENMFRIFVQYLEAKENGKIIYRPHTDR